MKILKLQISLCLLMLLAIMPCALGQGDTKTVISTDDTSLTITRKDIKAKPAREADREDIQDLPAPSQRDFDEAIPVDEEIVAEEDRIEQDRRERRDVRQYDSMEAVQSTRRGPITSTYQSDSMKRLKKDLGLTEDQVAEIQDILSANLQQKNKNISTVRRQIVQQRRNLSDVLTPAQMEKAAGLFIQRSMSLSLMPGPGQTGFRKYRPGKPQPEPTPLEETDLEAESKALDAINEETEDDEGIANFTRGASEQSATMDQESQSSAAPGPIDMDDTDANLPESGALED